MTVSNPRRHARRRARRKNPRRHARRHARGPSRRGHRRVRRNPGMPVWAEAAVGGALGLAGFSVANAAAFAITQRLDPTLATVVRNRYILGGLVAIGGLLMAKKRPFMGAGLAAGGFAALAGPQIAVAIGNVIDVKATTPTATTPATPVTTTTATVPATPAAAAATQAGLAAVYANNMMGYQRAMSGLNPAMAAVYANNMKAVVQRMSAINAVYANNMKGMGAGAPLPNPVGSPWAHKGPFGY